jgi:outer membrane autotransporter protein
VGYRQDTVGLIGGVDILRGSNGTEGYVFGVQGGYMDSDVRFNQVSRVKFSGPTFGVYGTYMNGGFFLDGIVNANFMNMDVTLPLAPPSLTRASSDARSYGGQIEAGYQMPIGASAFWEPIAGLSYVHTDIHDLNLGASGLVTYPDTTSFRGSLGLRLGMTGDFQYYRVRASLTGRYIDEFDGSNNTLIISPGPSNLALSDSLHGGFGEVALGTNMFATGGHLSAFANASIRFQSDYQATSVTAGFRYQW